MDGCWQSVCLSLGSSSESLAGSQELIQVFCIILKFAKLYYLPAALLLVDAPISLLRLLHFHHAVVRAFVLLSHRHPVHPLLECGRISFYSLKRMHFFDRFIRIRPSGARGWDMLDLLVSSQCTPTPPPPPLLSPALCRGVVVTFARINRYPVRSKFKRTTATSHLTNLHRP